MIIDFRYHVASLVAIFLALGIGILIGGALLGNTALQKELGQIQEDLAKLRNDQRALSAEIEQREADLRVYRQFGAAVLPALVKDKLVGKRAALVRTNPGTDARLARDLARLLEVAGCEVTSTTTFLRDPAELAPEKLQTLAAQLGIEGEEPAALAERVLRVAIDRIVNGPLYGESAGKTLLSYLSGAKIIETGGDYSGMVDILIFFVGSSDPALDTGGRMERVLLDTATETKGLLVAAVEPTTTARSSLTEYLKYPIIVVDNIDSAPGQTALVFALVRGKKGHYGVKNSGQLLPEVF
ncbi:MAG: copper transporter [Firmicutes bacterium]|nr:copper transporter [Bacillota bacterium]